MKAAGGVMQSPGKRNSSEGDDTGASRKGEGNEVMSPLKEQANEEEVGARGNKLFFKEGLKEKSAQYPKNNDDRPAPIVVDPKTS